MVQMIDRTAEAFMAALDEAERTGKIDLLVALFAEDAELRTLVLTGPFKGREGVRQFWEAYLSAFRKVHTAFTHAIEGRGGIALEWVSTGVLPTGEPIEYEGVTVLELEEGLIRRFRGYHDTAAFVRSAPAPVQS